jgi:hypothetical protein
MVRHATISRFTVVNAGRQNMAQAHASTSAASGRADHGDAASAVNKIVTKAGSFQAVSTSHALVGAVASPASSSNQ